MLNRRLTALTLILALSALLLAPLAMADDDEKPTLAFLRFGGSTLISIAESGILDTLELYGFISPDERAGLNESVDLEGEHIDVVYRDAGWDIATANLMIEDALDRGADVLMTWSAPVTQIAANMLSEMDDPPVIIFTIVMTPYIPGVADTPCVKPDYVAGTQTMIPYEQFVDMVHALDPEITKIGTYVTMTQPNSVHGMERIVELGGELGIEVETAALTGFADLPLATDALISKGAQAILVHSDYFAGMALATIVQAAKDQGVPVFSPVAQHVYRGATVGAGFYNLYNEGVVSGRILAAHLNGDIDVSRTAINKSPGFTVALNLDIAAETEVEISDELLAVADWTIQDGQSNEGETPGLREVSIKTLDMSLEERKAADLEFLAGLQCTDEMIAEQQAALDAAGG